MNLTADVIVFLVVLAPFVAAAVAPILQRLLGALNGWVLALVPLALGWLLVPLLPRVAAGETIHATVRWVPSLGVELGFVIDGLSLTFTGLILGIGSAILVYSAAYLRGHRHQGRFMAYLMVFMGAMLGLVLVDDLVALYVFWELTTVASFLLIGFDHARQAARRAAIMAVIVTTAGGLGLLVAAILLRGATGSWSIAAIGDFTQSAVYPAVLAAILFAAFTKSAQVPFHFWLPNAMEAPTPVSAYLHSATMVQGGVYLLMRTHPALGGTAAWTVTLTVVGTVTLIWGAVAALRQTDLKWLLAQSTIASLGLTVILLGVGTAATMVAAIVYFVAHALYKATLFLVVGLIDKEAGLRDLTALGGLRERMAVTFIAAVFGGLSMFGLPPALGYFAKEETYLGLVGGDWAATTLLAVMIAGNAALGAVALAVMLKPFMGPAVALPKSPREGPFGMLLAVAVLAALGLVAGWQVGWLATAIVSPAASAAAGASVESHIVFSLDPSHVSLWLTLATWGLALVMYRRLDWLRALTRRSQAAWGWTFDRAFDAAMTRLIRFASALTGFIHHGRLELYLVVVFAMFLIALVVPLWLVGGVPPWPETPSLTFYEWGVVLLCALGVLAVVLARSRLFAVIALGVQGLGVALLFILFGAPDLSFTQFMVEILSVVILALVMTRLRLDAVDRRAPEEAVRDGGLALLCGTGVTLLLLAVLRGPFDSRLSDFFAAASYPLAHGRNIVNVILVDFRGLDTLGEIAVVMTAGIAVLALLRGSPTVPAPAPRQPARRRRRAGTGGASASGLAVGDPAP